MRPRSIARPAAAGALCFAFTCAGAQSALAQSETVPSTPAPSATTAQQPKIAVRKRKTDVRAGTRAAVRGKVAPGAKGLLVSLQVKRDGRWKSIDARPHHAARPLRAPRARHAHGRRRRCASASPPSPAWSGPRRAASASCASTAWSYASWYGPGLYGNRTACGQTLGVRHDGRRPQVAAVRREGDLQEGRARGHRARHRPRPLRGRPRVRPHRGHRPEAALRAGTAPSSPPADAADLRAAAPAAGSRPALPRRPPRR